MFRQLKRLANVDCASGVSAVFLVFLCWHAGIATTEATKEKRRASPAVRPGCRLANTIRNTLQHPFSAGHMGHMGHMFPKTLRTENPRNPSGVVVRVVLSALFIACCYSCQLRKARLVAESFCVHSDMNPHLTDMFTLSALTLDLELQEMAAEPREHAPWPQRSKLLSC